MLSTQRTTLALVFAFAAAAASPAFGALDGQIIPDPDRPSWLRHSRGCPHFLCGPGDPEGFLYRGTRNADGTRDGDQLDLIARLADTGANAIYMQIIRSNGGDGDATHNPFVDNDPDRGLNQAVLDQWEQWFDAMDDAGIVIFLFFYDDHACVWGCDRSDTVPPEERTFLSSIVDRFEHHRNLIWVVAEEYQEAFSAGRVRAIAEVVRGADDFDHVIAVHQLPGLDFDFADDPDIDQFAVQYGDADSTPDDLHGATVDAWNRAAGRYNLNMSEIPYGGVGTDASARRKMWAMAMGGAYVMANGWDIATTPVARLEECGRMVSLLQATPLPQMAPRDDLARAGTEYVLADPENAWVAYSAAAGGTVGLAGLPAGAYDLRWLDTVDGTVVDQWDVAHPGGDASFPVPAGIGDELAVYVRRRGLGGGGSLTLGADKRTLMWCRAEMSGSCGLEGTFDTLRSGSASDFGQGAECVETGGTDAATDDPDVPAPGTAFHYLVRRVTSCPGGETTLGVDGSGQPRSGRSCP